MSVIAGYSVTDGPSLKMLSPKRYQNAMIIACHEKTLEQAAIEGRNVRRFRTALGISMKTLGELCETAANFRRLTQPELSDIEAGKRRMHPRTLAALAAALDREIEELTSPSLVAVDQFVLAAAFDEEWQAEINRHLVRALNQRGIAPRVYLPQRNYDWREQRRLLDKVLSNQANLSGGLVVVSPWTQSKVRWLYQFARAFEKPLVFVDHQFLTGIKTPANVSCVIVRDRDGGRLAAEIASEFLKGSPPDRRVLVITGDARRDRAESFAQHLQERLTRRIEVCKTGDFDRRKSRYEATRYLLRCLQTNSPVHLIFCTTDSMALGLCDALREHHVLKMHKRPLIIGYDGTPAVRDLLGLGVIDGIVLQDASVVADRAVAQLQDMIGGRSRREELYVPPGKMTRSSS